MSGLITFLFIIIVCVALIKRSKNALMDQQIATRKGAQAPAGRPRGFTNYRPHNDITSVSRDMSDKNSSVLRDDKNNDWLARQLREEHRAFKMTSEMFDLKIEHASHCDARILEQFHRRNCDASGVDLANGSSTMNRSIEDQ